MLEPDLVGTITLTSGQTGFTWSGQSLSSADVKEGDTIYLPLKGLSLKIASRTSATAGTLTHNCPAAAAGSGQAALIEFKADLSRAPAAMADVLSRLDSGNLWSLAGINGTGGDWGVHLTGAGTMARHAQTSFGRAAAALTGAAGSFIRATGAGAAVMQAIVGTASQAGGTPTGAIIGRGENANGQWVRLADGTQFCWHLLELSTMSGGWRSSWTIPVNFTGSFSRAVIAIPDLVSSSITSVQRRQISTASASSSHNSPFIDVYILPDSTIDTGSETLTCNVAAIGRWF